MSSRADPKKNNKKATVKTVYLIRHGQSKGQAAKKRGLDRKRDLSLKDCGLTSKGIQQAEQVLSFLEHDDRGGGTVELVVSSPLTRALQTAVRGFQYQAGPGAPPPILVHYGLREIGSALPENSPKKTQEVLTYIQEHRKETADVVGRQQMQIDAESLRPPHWPNVAEEDKHENSQRVERIQSIFQWLAVKRPERCIAVVCHYGVIRAALSSSTSGSSIRPRNAHPIRCTLQSNGQLTNCEEL